jgi:hypothetical protein
MIEALIVVGLMFVGIAWAMVWGDAQEARELTRRAEILQAREAMVIKKETMQ